MTNVTTLIVQVPDTINSPRVRRIIDLLKHFKATVEVAGKDSE